MQFNFDGYLLKLFIHQQEHFSDSPLSQIDDSCIICYPITTVIPKNFQNFYQWYCAEYPVSDFSGKSLEYFYQISQIYTQFNLPQYKNTIFKLIFSFRYSSSPGNLTDIIRSIASLTIYTSCFHRNPFSLPAEFEEEDRLHKDFEDYSDSIENLFALTPVNTPQPSPTLLPTRLPTPLPLPINAMTTAHDVLNYLREHEKGGMLLRIEPFKGDGTQDPLTWIEDFNKASQANKWNLGRKKDILAAFLRDNAEDWTTTINNYANAGTDWNAVETAFKNAFCTQRWHNKWLRELDSLKQGPEESVDSYYARFKRLVKRVNTQAAQLSDPQKLFYFKKGLRPAILPILLTHDPNDLAALLELARTYEQGTDFATNANPGPSNPNAAAYEKEIEQLTQQMNQMSLNYATIASALSAQTEPTYRQNNPINPTRSPGLPIILDPILFATDVVKKDILQEIACLNVCQPRNSVTK